MIHDDGQVSIMQPKNQMGDMVSSSQKKQSKQQVYKDEKALMKKHKSLDPVTKLTSSNEVNVAQQ